MVDLAEGARPFGVPVFVVGEFVRVVTHPRVFDPPTDLATAVGVVDSVLASPVASLLSPRDRYWGILVELLTEIRASGTDCFDAQIAAVCAEHGVDTILTEDVGFRRFPGMRVRRLTAP